MKNSQLTCAILKQQKTYLFNGNNPDMLVWPSKHFLPASKLYQLYQSLLVIYIKSSDFDTYFQESLHQTQSRAGFGWYRQVNGGNFYISLKQVLEAEKKIRKLSLLQQHGLLEASKLNKDDDPSSSNLDDVVSPGVENFLWLENFLTEVTSDDLSENDANVAFFVSGYIGRSITRRRKCASCKELLIKSNEVPPIPASEIPEHTKLLEMADRGGLSVPTEYCFAVTTLAVQYYTAIIANDSAEIETVCYLKSTLCICSCSEKM